MNEAFVAVTVWAPHGGGNARWVLSSKGSLIAQGIAQSATQARDKAMTLCEDLNPLSWQIEGRKYRRTTAMKHYPVSQAYPGGNRYDFTAQEASV